MVSGLVEGALTLRVAGASLVTVADTVDTMLDRLIARRAAHRGDDVPPECREVLS